jgi:(E)-4-hydroxy-3-methylbut-2-enyl-diphosphate synthase
MTYPLHLGVTEAGNGDDARIKSATGIGSLLLDGLGDTIRVSLAEDPEAEIPVAQTIARLCAQPFAPSAPPEAPGSPPLPWDPFHYTRRATRPIQLGSLQVGDSATIAVAGQVADREPAALPMLGSRGLKGNRPDALVLDLHAPADLERVQQLAWKG